MGLEGETLECVLDALPEGVDRDAVPSPVFEDAAAGCVREDTFGGAFASRLGREYPGRYSAGELSCLAEAYGSLSNEDVRLLVTSGFEPHEPSQEVERILSDLYGGCGVDAPPP